MSDQSWTIGRLLTWTTDYLGTRGSSSPRLDAEVLLAHVRGCQRIALYTAFDQLPTPEERDQFRALVKRRAEGQPVAYLVGQREFYSLPFDVSPAVLIPRPETEHLVIRLLDLAKAAPGGTKAAYQIADVGTGSGILATCAAKYLPGAQIKAIDQSSAALAVARKNLARHGVAERVELVEGDLLSPLSEAAELDFILSNPPYVSEAEYAELSPEVREHEPREALVGGPRGDELIGRLIPQASARLKRGGWLLIEISPMIEPYVAERLAREPGLVLHPTIKDLASSPRIAQAQKV